MDQVVESFGAYLPSTLAGITEGTRDFAYVGIRTIYCTVFSSLDH